MVRPARVPARSARLVAGLVAGGLVFGVLAGHMVGTSHSAQVLGLAIVLLPVALWKRPQLAPAVIVAGALAVEQFGSGVEPATGETSMALGMPELTAHIPITSSLPLFHGLGSIHLAPADLLLVSTFLLYLVKTAPGARLWPRSALATAAACLAGAVLYGVVIGALHHGDVRVALMEARPLIYVATTYLLASVLLRSREAVRAVLWALVLTTGFKAVQGLYIYFQVRHMSPRPEALLAHEQALFFALSIFLTAALWLFRVPGRLRTTATWLLPLVVAADLVNNRRTAWILLAAGFVVLAAIGYRRLPSRRVMLARTIVIVMAILAVYLPAFWNHTGGLAQPARAIHSQVSPDKRDASSDEYRVEENANLRLNIQEGGVLGRGFGVPIDYALPITDISSIDPLIKYVPHNGVLYVPMRMGLLGTLALWGLLGVGLMAGCRLAAARDGELAAIGAVLACALVAYAFQGGFDQGFFFYRIAFVIGTLLGLAEAARRLTWMQSMKEVFA